MIFFTDLDGTLIRSALRKRAGDIVVEYKDGCEITCISAESAAALAGLDSIVPVTSRSVEQYRRIKIPGFSPRYAICDNGGNLLVDGVPDNAWAAWAASVAEEYRAELRACRDILEIDADRSFEIRLVDGLFLFTKSNNPERTLERLSCAGTALDLYNTGAKIYAIPPEFNKGATVERLVGVLGRRGEKIVCAGDSVMDISMLESADIAIFPYDLVDYMSDNLWDRGISCPRGEFCEFTVNTFKEFMRLKGKY